MTRPKTPTGMSPAAQRFWRSAVTTYTFRIDELRLLEDACREMDWVDRLEKEMRGGKLMVKGSMGQDVASPLLQELRHHRATVARLLTQLELPSGEGAAPASNSSAARALANGRWHPRGRTA